MYDEETHPFYALTRLVGKTIVAVEEERAHTDLVARVDFSDGTSCYVMGNNMTFLPSHKTFDRHVDLLAYFLNLWQLGDLPPTVEVTETEAKVKAGRFELTLTKGEKSKQFFQWGKKNQLAFLTGE